MVSAVDFSGFMLLFFDENAKRVEGMITFVPLYDDMEVFHLRSCLTLLLYLYGTVLGDVFLQGGDGDEEVGFGVRLSSSLLLRRLFERFYTNEGHV